MATALIAKEVQFKTTISFQFDGHYRKDKRQKVLMRMWKKGNLCTPVEEMKISTTILENSMKGPGKSKNKAILFFFTMLLLGIYPRKRRSI